MSEPFTLVIPADGRFRALAPDIAGRYAELAGSKGAGVTEAVAAAVEAVTKGASANGEIHMTFRPVALRQAQGEPGAIEVEVRCGAVTRTITCPL